MWGVHPPNGVNTFLCRCTLLCAGCTPLRAPVIWRAHLRFAISRAPMMFFCCYRTKAFVSHLGVVSFTWPSFDFRLYCAELTSGVARGPIYCRGSMISTRPSIYACRGPTCVRTRQTHSRPVIRWLLHRESKKTRHQTLGHDFTKY